MLDNTLKTQLRSYLELLRHPIQVSAWFDDSPASGELRELLDEVQQACSKVLVVEQAEPAPRTPSFSVHLPGEEGRVRFAGLPLGHEFTSLVLALLHVGGHPPKVTKEVLARIDGLSKGGQFETYFSQSCQNCPDVIQSLNLMAARNPAFRHEAIDGALFPEEVEDRKVMAVPSVFRDGQPFSQGRQELGELLGKLDTGAAEENAKALAARDVFDVLVVGGGPAGAAAAVYAARKGISTGLVADRFGGQLLDTVAIENFISVPVTEGPRLVAALEAHVGAYPVDVIKNQRARKLVPGDTIGVELACGATLRAKSVVLATGARWRDMGVPGEKEYRTRGVTYCPHCDGPLFKGKRVAVVGGGNSGVEAAIDLAGVVEHVTLIEFAEVLKADAVLQRKLKSMSNVEVLLNTQTTEVRGNGDHVTGLVLLDRGSKKNGLLEVAGVFVQIGLLPNSEWLAGAVELSPNGEIEVTSRGATSVPGVFAAGDVTTVPYKQIIIAAGEGAKAALGAFDHLIRASAPEA